MPYRLPLCASASSTTRCEQPTLRLGRFSPRQLVITRGVAARGNAFIDRAVRAVRNFRDFGPNNDPYGEHDFGIFDLDSETLNWKIDYYDHKLEYGSPDRSDPAVTRRVLTILLAEEF